MDQKTCKKCGAEKPATIEFFPHRPNGKITPVCRDCERVRIAEFTRNKRASHGREDRSAEYAKRKADRLAAAGFSSAQARLEHAARGKARRDLVATLKRLAKAKEQKTLCWLWENPSLTKAEMYRMRYRMDEQFNLKERIRRQLTKQAKRDHVAELMRGALKRGGSSNAVQRLVGYTIADLRKHLEKQFVSGMGWHNMHRWHIDHITPQSAFDLSKHDEWRACWCLSNLRPMWARANLAKSARLTHLL